MTEETQNELIPLKKLQNPLQIFTESEMDKLIEEIKKITDKFEPDLTTDKSRKEIASMAYKVSRSKTALEKLSSDLTEDWKTKTKSVVDVRIKMSARLDALRDEVRKPLTDWEDGEKERIAKHKKNIEDMRERGEDAGILREEYTVDVLKVALAHLEAITIDDGWKEFEDNAKEVKSIAIDKFNIAIQRREIIDKEQAELKALREAAAKRQAEEEQKRVLEAEKQAQAERERYAAEQNARIEKERADAAEKAKRKAEETATQVAAEKAEIQRQKDLEAEKEQKAAIQAKEAAEQATEDARRAGEEAATKAAADERQKIKDEENARLADEKRREANKEHQRKINNQAVNGLIEAGLSKEKAHDAIKAIILGAVPNVKINY